MKQLKWSKKQRYGFLSISLLVNLLKVKGVKVKITGRGVMRASELTIKDDEETIRVSQYF